MAKQNAWVTAMVTATMRESLGHRIAIALQEVEKAERSGVPRGEAFAQFTSELRSDENR